MNTDRAVIVGAGLAGLRSAERLRELGFDGEVVIIGTEESMPYHRPALSKQFLTGALAETDLAIPPLEDLDVVWRLGTHVSGLDLNRRVLHLPGEERLNFDGLVIATGVEARRLSDGQHGHPRVVTVRTVADARRIKRNLVGNRRPVIVLGTGFTGCEIASTVRQMGRPVTIVGRGQTLMGKAVGEELGGRLTQLHRDHGVELVLGPAVTQWRLYPESVELALSDGRELEGACVVVAVGTVPATRWLAGSGVPVDDGVLCEATTHVIGTEDVVAAGDVANWPNLHFSAESRRTEHWTNAIEMGRAAAESLLAGRQFARPYMPLPRFWSEQHGVRIQAAGVPSLGNRVRRLSGNGLRSVSGYELDGRLVGVVGLNSATSVLRLEEVLMQEGLGVQHQLDAGVAAGGSRAVS